MFNSIKKLLTKTFVQQKKKKQTPTRKEKESTTTEPSSLSSFEPSYIEPSSEPVIKRTQRTLKYRR